MGEASERVIELEGRHYLVLKKIVDNCKLYSLDGGANWASTMIEAYQEAKEAGTLATLHDHGEDQSEFEVFILKMIDLLKDLQPGEAIKISRAERDLVVTKEIGVLRVKGSAIEDIDLQIKEAP